MCRACGWVHYDEGDDSEQEVLDPIFWETARGVEEQRKRDEEEARWAQVVQELDEAPPWQGEVGTMALKVSTEDDGTAYSFYMQAATVQACQDDGRVWFEVTPMPMQSGGQLYAITRKEAEDA